MLRRGSLKNVLSTKMFSSPTSVEQEVSPKTLDFISDFEDWSACRLDYYSSREFRKKPKAKFDLTGTDVSELKKVLVSIKNI